MRPLALARIFGWALFLVRIVIFDTLELVRGHALHDYASFHAAACAVRGGVSAYKPEELLIGSMSCGMGAVHPYFYPPLLSEALVPMTYLQPWTARLVWHGVIVCSVIAAVFLLDRWLRTRGEEVAGVFLFAAASFWPLRESHLMGQVNTLVLLLLCVWWTKREKSDHAVIALAFAAAIKMSPALLFLVPLVERRYRELARGVTWTVAAVFLSCAVLGKRGFEFFYGVLGGFIPGAQWHGLRLPIEIFGNSSIAAVLMRLGHPADPQRLPGKLALIQTIILVALLGAWLVRQKHIAPAARALPLLVLMIVAPTFAWEHHLTFALLGVAMILAEAKSLRWPLLLLAAAATAWMADRLDYYVMPPGRYGRTFWAIARSPKLVALLVLFVVGLFVQNSQAGRSEATREKVP